MRPAQLGTLGADAEPFEAQTGERSGPAWGWAGARPGAPGGAAGPGARAQEHARYEINAL